VQIPTEIQGKISHIYNNVISNIYHKQCHTWAGTFIHKHYEEN